MQKASFRGSNSLFLKKNLKMQLVCIGGRGPEEKKEKKKS